MIGTGTQWQHGEPRPGRRLPGERPQLHGDGRPLRHPAGDGAAHQLRRRLRARLLAAAARDSGSRTWANCIAKSGTCRFFDPTTASLVADDRVEIGYAYDDSPFLYSTSGNGAGLPVLRIDGATTSATRDITLTAVGPNRHYGLPGTGVVLDAETSTGGGVWIFDDHVTVEWLEIKGGSGATAHGIVLGSPPVGNRLDVRFNLVHDVPGNGVDVYQSSNVNLLLAHNIVHTTGGHGVYLDPTPLAWTGQLQILNNTVANTNGGNSACYKGVGVVGSNTSRILLANNIGYFLAGTADDFDFPDNDPADGWADVNPASRRNLSSDSSATRHNVTPGGPVSGGTVNYVNFPLGNLHLNSPSDAIDGGADLSSLMAPLDIDGQGRPIGPAWDIGADEFGSTTAVKLMSFAAVPGDGAVVLEWRTGSELSNLGFHVYRGPSADGPWTRLTSSLIPGLGSSPIGQSYSWTDTGLANGATYFYRLEDVDTASVSTFHGPVSATPVAVSAPPPPEGGGGEPGGGSGGGSGGGGGPTSTTCPSWVLASLGTSSSGVVECTRHGDPDAVSFEVLSRDARGATLELRTGGFWALLEPSGTVRVFVPGFDTPREPSAPALPLRRALVEAVVGKKVRLVSAEAFDLRGFKGLRPSAVGVAEMSALVGRDGAAGASRRRGAAPVAGVPAAVRGSPRGDGLPGGDEECRRGDDAGAVRRVPAAAGPGEPGAGAPGVHGTGVGGDGDGKHGTGGPAEGDALPRRSRPAAHEPSRAARGGVRGAVPGAAAGDGDGSAAPAAAGAGGGVPGGAGDGSVRSGEHALLLRGRDVGVDGLLVGSGVGAGAADGGRGDGGGAGDAGGRARGFVSGGLCVVRDEPDLPVGAAGGPGRVAVGGPRRWEPGADGDLRAERGRDGLGAAGAGDSVSAGRFGVWGGAGAPRSGVAERGGGGRRAVCREEAVPAEPERPGVAAPRGSEHPRSF